MNRHEAMDGEKRWESVNPEEAATSTEVFHAAEPRPMKSIPRPRLFCDDNDKTMIVGVPNTAGVRRADRIPL
jgi:hypothetical protein